MTRLHRGAVALIAGGTLVLACSLSPLAVAQDTGVPPADVGGPQTPAAGAPPDAGAPDTGAPDATGDSSDDASLLVRVERLEEQIRDMTGQIEQMQFENRKLEDQLQKFQQDVDFRFQEGHGRPLPKHQDSGALSAPAAPLAADSTGAITPPASHLRGDAFDPNANPNAPGAPRALGTTSASAPIAPPAGSASASDSDAPIDLPSAEYNGSPAPAGVPAAPASQPGGAAVEPQAGGPPSPVTTPGGTVIASAEVNPTKEEFDVALGYFKQKDYDSAERSFSAFLQQNPKSHLTSDALYYLGETYYQRGRQREAAEQYLKISTDYATAPRAPEAMLRLGESLQALGAKEQACATFSAVPIKYPNASAAVKAGAEREAKRAQC
jgi:tol-pal system protein YbgF